MKKTHSPAPTLPRSDVPLAYVNGQFLPEASASISIFDRGFLYGDGLFETLRVYHGKIFRLAQHLWRLKGGMEALKIVGAPKNDALAAAVTELVALNGISDGFVRILLTRGLGEVGLGIAEAREPLLVIYAQTKSPRPDEEYQQGWRTIVSTIPANAKSWLEVTKTISRVHHVMAKAEAEAAGVHDALMLNTDGYVAEGTTSNFFILKRGRLLTAPIPDGLLPGITRAAILELAQHLRIPFAEARLKPRHLFSADEAFLTSTLVEIMPVVEINGHKIGKHKTALGKKERGIPGPLTQKLRHEFRELVRRELGSDVFEISG